MASRRQSPDPGDSPRSADPRATTRAVGAPLRSPKRKVSFTLDRSLVTEVEALAGEAPLSGVVNDLLTRAVEQERLRRLADDLVAEAGEPSAEAYEHVLAQWFRDDT